jgi:uncharacterized protein (DUF1810 family)
MPRGEADVSDVDRYDLQRFVVAQDPIYDRVIAELGRGKKTSHWMWFIFPQIEGLGSSPMSTKFAISSRGEASEYLNHPILGRRLRECSRIVSDLSGRSSEELFGSIDSLKFHSCMTLFHLVSSADDVFKRAIEKYFDGQLDLYTDRKLSE